MKKCCVVFLMTLLVIANSFGQKDQQFNFKIDGTINADTGTVTLHYFSDYIPKNDSDIVAKVKNFPFFNFATISLSFFGI